MPGVSALVLRDVQLGPAPSWWPPAPGWWLLVLALLVLLAGLALWQLLLWRRRRQWQQHFDAAIAQAGSPLQRVQQASELLRRAALAQQPDAASLAGEAWQCWLAQGVRKVDARALQLLAEGGYRRQLDQQQADLACALARQRFIAVMVGR